MAKMSGTKGLDFNPSVQYHWLQNNLNYDLSNETKMKEESLTALNKVTENKHYIFMLVGSTGSGRSATGNSILSGNHFACSDESSSMTRQCSIKTTLRDQIKVTVIDTPAVIGNSSVYDGAKTKSCNDLTTAMTECPKDGKLIIVLVLKYGERFTEENRQMLYILENIFGDTNMWKSCILIMTHGDVFNINNEAGITFEGWSESQKDDLGKMFKDCSYRCLLYNNRTKNQEERKEQFAKLIEFSNQIDQGYTMTTFVEAKRHRNRLILEGKLIDIMKAFNAKIKELIFSSSTISDRDDKYVAFKEKVNRLRDELDIEDNRGLIYYADGELCFLNEQRNDLNYLEEDVDIRVTLGELEKEASLIRHERLNGLEFSIDFLETQIDRKTGLLKYKSRIVLLREKVSSKKLEIKRQNANECYDMKVRNLYAEIIAVPRSTDLDILAPYYAKIDLLFSEMSHVEEELGRLQYCHQPAYLKELVKSKIEQSSHARMQRMGALLCAVFIVVIGMIIFVMRHK